MNITEKIWLLLLSLFCSISVVSGAGIPPLEEWVGRDASLFQTLSAGNFLKDRSAPEMPYFRWTSEKYTDARYPGYSNSPEITFCGCKVPEVIFSFQNEALVRVYISIFNRGDMGNISMDEFEKNLRVLEEYFVQISGGQKAKESKTRIGKSFLRQKAWVLPSGITVQIRFSVTGKARDTRPEFLQITYERPEAGKKNTASGVADSMKKGESKASLHLAENIRKETDGTVFVDNIPMVDQGDKGYCAVAVAERVMRYFGNDTVNQHTMAQLAETSERGTSGEQLIQAMKKIAKKCGLRFKVQYQLAFNDLKDFEKYVKKYNSAAKKMKREKVEIVLFNNVVYMDQTMAQMSPDVTRAMRLADRAGMNKFNKNIKASVDKGVPLVWGVELGLVREKEIPQARGGHIRLIIGYNEAKKQIVYSDTWGAGHEKKIMSAEDAWVITHMLATLEPPDR